MIIKRLSNLLSWFGFGYISLFATLVFMYHMFGIQSPWAQPLLFGTYDLFGEFGFVVVWVLICSVNYLLSGKFRTIPWKKIQ